MRKINKSEEPQSLKIFNRGIHNSWSDIHNNQNKHVYFDCITQCEYDQGGICAYTEIATNVNNRHIDHYIKRDLDSTLVFSWGNMVCAVKDHRFGANWKDSHISAAGGYDKLRKCYLNLINPVRDTLCNRFKYSTDGGIEPVNDNDIMAWNTINVFNLNEESLKSRRKEKMQLVWMMIDGGMGKTEILNYLSSDGFISVIEYELSFIQ